MTLRCRASLRQAVEQGARAINRCGLHPAELCPGRSLPVRLESRGDPVERNYRGREGRHLIHLARPNSSSDVQSQPMRTEAALPRPLPKLG
jgi:hypothetical protein